jgi:bis(5'-nucleosyl)-tetraphosphatase (symmetrical)
MARWAIGDVQGCCDELEQLLARIRFSGERDRLWFVGDLVNRGPRSLKALRLVRSAGRQRRQRAG